MSRTTMTAAFAAMLAISAPALADTATAANHVMPGQMRVTQVDGATVYDTQNQNIGDIKDIILDRDGKVAAVILDVGSFLGMGGKYVAVSMNDLKVTYDNNNPNKPRFTVNMTKDQLKSAQAFDLNNEKNTATGSSTAPVRSTTATPPATTAPTTTMGGSSSAGSTTAPATNGTSR